MRQIGVEMKTYRTIDLQEQGWEPLFYVNIPRHIHLYRRYLQISPTTFFSSPGRFTRMEAAGRRGDGPLIALMRAAVGALTRDRDRYLGSLRYSQRLQGERGRRAAIMALSGAIRTPGG